MMRYQTVFDDVRGKGKLLVQASRFVGPDGVEEIHLVATSRGCRDFKSDVADLSGAYSTALRRLGLSPASTVFRRLFLSDIANQAGAAAVSPLVGGEENAPAISLVEQPPLPHQRVALWAYHVNDPAGLRKQPIAGGVCVDRGANRHVWLTDLGTTTEPGAREQSVQALEDLSGRLGALGGNLRDHAIRTWFFVSNVDRNYAGLVRGRKDVFDRHGLTERTHYLASTGIEGRSVSPGRLVTLDAYAILGVEPRQVGYLSAPDHLGPTNLYGVTFERGTRVDFRDRRHLYISGTASIDPAGTSLHRLDPIRQAHRAAENMNALLANGGCGPGDVAQLIVYLRDGVDLPWIQAIFADRYPGVPTVFVRAPVCRPEWLVEVECIAIHPHAAPELPAF